MSEPAAADDPARLFTDARTAKALRQQQLAEALVGPPAEPEAEPILDIDALAGAVIVRLKERGDIA